MKELEGASQERSPSTAPSQDSVGDDRYWSVVLCQWTGKDKGAKRTLESPSCLPGKFLPLGIWAGLK